MRSLVTKDSVATVTRKGACNQKTPPQAGFFDFNVPPVVEARLSTVGLIAQEASEVG